MNTTYETLASADAVARAMEALEKRGIASETAADGAAALARIRELIPAGASVMNGSSRTLEQIGYIDVLKGGDHAWKNLKAAILAEKDPAKQSVLRKESVLSDWYLGSAHGVAETGEIVVASNSGSQLPHLVFTSQNVLLVVSAKKIAPTLDGALARLKEHVYPQEDARMKEEGVAAGSFISKLLIINREPAFLHRTFRVIFVDENLGF